MKDEIAQKAESREESDIEIIGEQSALDAEEEEKPREAKEEPAEESILSSYIYGPVQGPKTIDC